jgi:hypothetical protein
MDQAVSWSFSLEDTGETRSLLRSLNRTGASFVAVSWLVGNTDPHLYGRNSRAFFGPFRIRWYARNCEMHV